MKWFQHDTNTDSDPKIKLLKRKFGVIGKGIFFEVIRIIARDVEDGKVEDWGYLAKEYTDYPELLVDEIGTDSVQTLYAVINYCVEIGLLYRIDNRILNFKVLERADRYTRDICKKNNTTIEATVQKLRSICTEYSPTNKQPNIRKIAC
jgi:hypothetical protein